ncbi:MAG: DUF1203 domain-containing protein [Dongiaceae bacterium]
MRLRITGLPAADFAPLFALSDAELAARGALRVVADAPHAYPCRVSLTDAAPGDALLLVNYEHQPAATPYRSRHAVYVRDGETTFDAVDRVPDQLRRRILSLRAFDAAGMLLGADLAEGAALEPAAGRLLALPGAAYLHAHFAKPGCYAARIERA